MQGRCSSRPVNPAMSSSLMAMTCACLASALKSAVASFTRVTRQQLNDESRANGPDVKANGAGAMKRFDLHGEVAIVTGGNGGIGLGYSAAAHAPAAA